LSELGFCLERVQAIASTHSAFVLTLRFWLEARRRLPSRSRDLVLRLGHTMLVRLTCAPLFWVISQARLATVITLFARKRR